MVETTRSTYAMTPARYAAPATTALSRTSGTPFWALAFFLLLGLGVSLALALRGLSGPGVFTPSEADVATGLALFAMAVILMAFLLTIAYVFSEVRRLRQLAEARERSRIENITRQEDVNRQLRDEVAALNRREHLLVAELAKRRQLAAGWRASEGDTHVIQLEGIGPLYAARLNSIGIITVTQLVAADAPQVAVSIETTPEQVREWQAMGRLLRVKGVGPQWAEALARVGVQDEHDLAGRDPYTLALAIAHLNAGKVRVTKNDPPTATVARWVRSAGGHPGRTARPTAGNRNRPGQRGRSNATVPGDTKA